MFSLAAKEAEECSMLDRPNGPLKQGLRNICLKSKKQRKLIRFFINISEVLVIYDHLVQFWFNRLKKNYTQVQFYRKIQKYFKT